MNFQNFITKIYLFTAGSIIGSIVYKNEFFNSIAF